MELASSLAFCPVLSFKDRANRQTLIKSTRTTVNTMSSQGESEIRTPPHVREVARLTTLNLLPEKSRQKYHTTHKIFMDWRTRNNVNSFSEDVLLAYFQEMSSKYKASSLWTFYSMLRSTLSINNGVNIESFVKLRAFLKRKSENYTPTKAKTFTPEQINKFIQEAPDDNFLATKVALIMGIMGACRAAELNSMQVADIQDLGSVFMVTVPNTKTKISRRFAITGDFYHICKKYMDLRPSHTSLTALFLKFQKGKYFCQKIGINKFGAMGKDIATFLKLPNSGLYTGHCFRRSSATLLVDSGGDITALKRHGGWKSTTVAEGYIDESTKNKTDTANKIYDSINLQTISSSAADVYSSINQQPSTNTTTYIQPTRNETITLHNSKPSIAFTNCSHFTINFVNKDCP